VVEAVPHYNFPSLLYRARRELDIPDFGERRKARERIDKQSYEI